MMSYTKEPWNIGPETARYEVCRGIKRQALKVAGLPTEFEALSIGTDSGQVAIIPLDESNIDNAHLIVAAPGLLRELERMVEYYRHSEIRPEAIGKIKASLAIIAKAKGE